MGLLDQFTEFINTPGGQGLLSAGLGALGSRTALGGISRGGLLGLQAYTGAQDRQNFDTRQKVMDDRSGKMFELQLAQHQASLEKAKQAAEQQQMQQNYIGGIGKVTSPRIGAEPNKANPYSMLALGMSPEMTNTVMNAPTMGLPEVARTVEVDDGQGGKATTQLDKFGRPVGNNLPSYIAPVQVDTGGKVQFVKPQAGVALGKTMTPGEVASNAVARGNLAVSQQRFAFDKGQALQGKPEFKDGQWVVPPRDMRPGESRPVTAPTATKDANEALALIKQAREILPNSTGSYGGWMVDQGARFFGSSTNGAEASAKLKAIGGMLKSKMPKMSGPQSDKDVALYGEMAGQVADETLPIKTRLSALDAVEEIQRRQAGLPPASGAPSASGAGSKPSVSNW
jgi:hypothetical protein